MRFWPKSAPADDPAPAPPITTLTRRAPDWPSVPGIQRVVTSMTPIADRAGFEHSLRTHQDPTFLAPLAHLVDPDGPSGRISGLMTPAPTPIQPPSASVAKAGVVQRWPPRWLGGPVISRAADPSPAPAEAPADAIETPQVEDTAPDESHAEVQLTSAPIDPIAVRRAPAPTDPVAPQRTSAPADPRTAPLATTPIDPRTAQHATAPVDPIAVQRVSVPTDAVEVPEVRTAPLLSDPHHLQPPTAPATAPTPIAPAVPVQRSLVRAPEPEPLFRTLPVVAVPADADVTRDAPAESPAFSIPETEPETAREVGAFALPPRSPTESAPPTTSERSTADMPVPTVRDPEPARATSTPTIGVQRRASADGSTAGNTAPPAPTQESRLPLDTQPRKLGLGAPLERPPEPAAQVEVISLQQWAAARDAAPQVSQSSPQITAAEPVSERGPQMDTAPTAQPVATDPDPLTSEAGGLDSVSTLGADEPVAEHAVQRTPDRDIATYEAPPASANPPMQPTAESVALLGERPSLLETIAGSTPPSAADPTAPSATTPAFATPAAAGLAPTTTATAAVQRHPESSIPVHKDAVDSLVPRAIVKPGSPSVQRSAPAPPTPALAPALTLAPALAPAPAPAQRLVDDPAARPMSLLSIARAEHPVGRPESAAPAHPAATVQRSVRSATVAQVPRSAPAAAPAADPPGRRGADAGSIAVDAGIAHRESDGSVVFAMPDTAPRAASVQRAVEVGEMTVDNPAPASAPAGADASAPAASAPAASASAESASAPPAGGGPAAAAGATPNLDELARRLYDPLAARIKAELRLDRERFGLVTDLRRP